MAGSTLSTLTMTSVESLTLGIGLSSITTFPGPLKTTDFIILFAVVDK